MIIVNLKGGLGNIMFQYALGRYLAYKNKVELRFDVRSYKTNPLGDYSLSLESFNIKIREKLASPWDIRKFKIYQKRHGKIWGIYNYLVADEKKYAQEKSFHFDQNILTLKDNVYLNGWWQNEKYFVDIRDILLKDFTVVRPLVGKNKEIAKEIADSDSVGIHIRRLDYVTNSKTSEYHGVLTKEYYDRALSLINSKIPNPTLFVFSDDSKWAEKNMSFPFKTIHIGWNFESPHEDIRLMSLCKHHIVANSSFGWWGAWLATNPNQIVVAPKRWTNDKKDTNERVPERWIKI